MLTVLRPFPCHHRYLTSRFDYPLGFTKRGLQVSRKLKRVESSDYIKVVIRVGQLFDLADTEVAIRYSFAGDLDGRDVCIYPANLSASLGSQLCCESRPTANIQKLCAASNIGFIEDDLIKRAAEALLRLAQSWARAPHSSPCTSAVPIATLLPLSALNKLPGLTRPL